MSPEQATFLLNEIYLPQIRNEQKTTRRVIEAIPADKSGWKPDPTSKSALELAWHIASSECFFLNGIALGKFERTGDGSMPASIKTPADLVKWYDENHAKAVSQLAQLKGESLAAPIDFAVFKFPAVSYAGFQSNHSIHHRGQLSSYLRPMGGKVPSIYGPSADEGLPARASA
jgi:uncharacterized damage-inducible protein DinB